MRFISSSLWRFQVLQPETSRLIFYTTGQDKNTEDHLCYSPKRSLKAAWGDSEVVFTLQATWSFYLWGRLVSACNLPRSPGCSPLCAAQLSELIFWGQWRTRAGMWRLSCRGIKRSFAPCVIQMGFCRTKRFQTATRPAAQILPQTQKGWLQDVNQQRREMPKPCHLKPSYSSSFWS